jgi:hypothetical protein
MSTPEQLPSLTPSERYYKNHLKNVSNYQKRNPQKMREKNKKHNDKIKNEDAEKYQAKLLRQREYYQAVIKPRNDAAKKKEPEVTPEEQLTEV